MSKDEALADRSFSRPTDPTDAEWAFWLKDAASILRSNGTTEHADWVESAATRLEALQAQPVGEESGWLVEMVEPDNNKSPVPRWWHPEHGWMWDANKALRFAREIDAQDYITGSGRLPGKPTEHIFLDSAGGEA